MQEPNPTQKCTFITKVILSIIGVGLVLTGLICTILFLTRKEDTRRHPPKRSEYYPDYPRKMDELCTTEQCLRQADRILNNMDTTVNPCTDFYNFACGNFTKYAEIPRDQIRLLIALENKQIVENELIEAYNAKPGFFNPLIQDMKRFYYQCINNSDPHNNYGSIKEILWKLKWPVLFKNWDKEYATTFDWLQMEADFKNLGLSSIFLNSELKFDMRNLSVAYIGLDCTQPSLPKYVLADGKESKYVKKYRYVIKQFMGIIAKDYKGNASEEILDFFLNFENVKPTRFEMSDANFFHSFKKKTVEYLEKKLNIKLLWFLQKILPSSISITKHSILGTSSYQCLIKMSSLLRKSPKRHVANYMMWRASQSLLWIMSNETRRLNYELKNVKTGIEAEVPLYKLCLNFIDDLIPELSSAMYIKMFYDKNKKDDLEKMVKLLLEELTKVVNDATWMDKSTKNIAREKVKMISYVTDHVEEITQNTFLYDAYGKLNMRSRELITNVRNIKRAAYIHMMRTYQWTAAKRNRATLLPLAHVINAFYHPGLNAIAIPTGIAHGCIYSFDQEAYLNFGGIGIIIGHELSHVFDNMGRLYDAYGKYVNWWSKESNIKYEEKSRCFVEQYDQYTLGPNLKINGTLTLGENMADTGGTALAYRAYIKSMKKSKNRKLPGLESYTFEQMFWISVANTWCDKLRPEALKIFLKTDVHCVGNFRVLGPLSNNEDFARDFNCPANSKMNRKPKCTIW